MHIVQVLDVFLQACFKRVPQSFRDSVPAVHFLSFDAPVMYFTQKKKWTKANVISQTTTMQ